MMNENGHPSPEEEPQSVQAENSPLSLYLDSVKGVILLWHAEIMGASNTQNLNKILITSAQDIASCLQSEQSREELRLAHEIVMKAIEQKQAWCETLDEKHQTQLFALQNHFDERYQHIISTDNNLSYNSIPDHQRNGSYIENNYDSWNDVKYTHAQFEEKLSEYVQQLTLNLEKKYDQDFQELNKKHAEKIKQIEEFYENKFAEQKVNSSFSKIENDEEIHEIIKDRDNLREVTKNLRQVVKDLSNYVNNCETQLNKTLLNELINDNSIVEESSFQETKHVHFAPDISCVSEQRLDYSDFKLELETCLDRLKREANELLSATMNKCKHEGIEELVVKYEKEIEQLKQDAITPEIQSLQHQLEAADAQLKSSRKFIEEQTTERETEREEYLFQISQLKSALRDKKLYASLDEQSNILEQQVDETKQQLLAITEEKISLDTNLNEAKTKIWELREIVSTLEKELASSRENEQVLNNKISEFEELFEKQYHQHHQLVIEFENLKISSKHHSQMMEQLETPIPDSGLHQIKSQILWLEKTLRRRTKELETLYVFDPNLSSPSEDISARDEMVNTPDSGRVDSPGLPLEQMSSLYEHFLKHSRAEDATVKCLKDTVLQLTSVKNQLNEVVLERDALQGRYNKTLTELCEARVQLEELRHRLFSNKSSVDDEKNAEIDVLTDKLKLLTNALLIKDDELKHKDDEIKHKDTVIEQRSRLVNSMEQELSKIDSTDMRLRDASHMSYSGLKKPTSPIVHFNDISVNDTNNLRNFSFDKQNSTTQTENLKSEMKILESEKSNLKEQLVHKEQIIEEINTEADRLKTALEELQDKVTEAKRHTDNVDGENMILEYKKIIEAGIVQTQKYEDKIEDLKEELEKLNKHCEKIMEEKNEANKTVRTLEETIIEKEIKCNLLDVEIKQLKSELRANERKLSNFEKEIGILTIQLNENKILDTQNIEFANCIEILRKELGTYLEKSDTLREEKVEFIKREHELIREKENLQKTYNNLKKNFELMTASEEELKIKLSKSEEMANEKENETCELKQKQNELTKELEKLKFNCELYKGRVADVESREQLINNLVESIKLSEHCNNNIKKELTEIKQTKQELEKKLKESEFECKTYQKQLVEIQQNQTEKTHNVPTTLKIQDNQPDTTHDSYSILTDKLTKELEFSAKLDEALLKKQKDYIQQQQEQVINILTEDKKKLHEMLISERKRFENEQLQDADLLEKLRQKYENSRKIMNDLENEVKQIGETNVELLTKIHSLEKSIETYSKELNKSKENVEILERKLEKEKEKHNETESKLKEKLTKTKDKLVQLENELKIEKNKNLSENSPREMQNILTEQVDTLNSQALKICQLEKLCSDYKNEDNLKLKSLENEIVSLNEALLAETKKVLRLENDLLIESEEFTKSTKIISELNKKIQEIEIKLDCEKERVITLREKLLENSDKFAKEIDKNKELEIKLVRLQEEKTIMGTTTQSEEQNKQMRHILSRLFRAESCNKSLIFQKRYLKNMINCYVQMECKTVQILEGRPHEPFNYRKKKFKCAVLCIISISRMKYLVKKRSHTMLRRLK